MAGNSNKKIITLGLDYSQLDGGTAEINRKMKILESQFQLTKEQIKAYGDETDQLNLTQEKLTQQISLQAKKVEQSRQAYDAAVASGKASDKQLDNLQKSYITNQTQLQKLNNELSENKTKLDNATKSTSSFGDSIRGITSTLGINTSPALEAVATKFDGVSKSMGNAVMGIGTMIAILGSFSISLANTADDLFQLSSITGLTTDQLQKMQYASKFLDVETETMTGSISKLTRSMDSARNGSKELQDAFSELHVKVKDGSGSLLDSEQVFYQTIDALGKIKNETERNALAMQVFGKSAQELNPLIEAGSEKLKSLGIEAEKLGRIMSKEELEKASKLKDALDGMASSGEALKEKLGMVLIPLLTALFTALSKIPTPVLETIVVLASIVASIILVIKALKSMTETTSAISEFFSNMDTKSLKTVGIILAVVAALIALVAIIAVLAGKGNELQSSMSSIGASVSQITGTVNSVPQNTSSAIGYANGTRYAAGGGAWVGENGPEYMYVPRGSQVYTNAESQQMIGETNIYVTVPANDLKEVNDVVTWAKGLKQKYRSGVINIG